MGYTFKENCVDTRNTKVRNLILLMQNEGFKVDIWDPLISEDDHKYIESIGVHSHKKQPSDTQLVFLCVYHEQILKFLEGYDGLVYDYRKPINSPLI